MIHFGRSVWGVQYSHKNSNLVVVKADCHNSPLIFVAPVLAVDACHMHSASLTSYTLLSLLCHGSVSMVLVN